MGTITTTTTVSSVVTTTITTNATTSAANGEPRAGEEVVGTAAEPEPGTHVEPDVIG